MAAILLLSIIIMAMTGVILYLHRQRSKLLEQVEQLRTVINAVEPIRQREAVAAEKLRLKPKTIKPNVIPAATESTPEPEPTPEPEVKPKRKSRKPKKAVKK